MTKPAIFIILVWVLAASAIAQNPDAQAAYDDRAKYCASEEEFKYVYYLTLRPWAGVAALDLERAVKLQVASTSRQPVLERCVPVKISPTLMRIDLRDLGWRFEDWANIVTVKNNPYTDKELPLVNRADWFLLQISDMVESNAYHELLYGENQPKTRDDILKFFNVGGDKLLTFGMIEGKSGVAQQGVRRIESHPILRGYAWGTFDVANLTRDQDPLENAAGNFRHDAEEWILGIPKVSIENGLRGCLQVYFLANGQQLLQDRAPVDIVSDSTHFRGHPEIRVPGGCIQCHESGLNPVTLNAFRELTKSGVDVFADYKNAAELEAFHLTDLEKEIARANDDYQTIVEYICGAKSADVSKSFKAAIDRYDEPLDLAQTADELHVTVEEWNIVLAQSGAKLSARLASLPNGGRIPRDAWEDQYLPALLACHKQTGLEVTE